MATLRNTSVPADLIQSSIRKAHIVVETRKPKKKKLKKRDARSDLLFCSHNQLFLTSSSPSSATESEGSVEIKLFNLPLQLASPGRLLSVFPQPRVWLEQVLKSISVVTGFCYEPHEQVLCQSFHLRRHQVLLLKRE